MSEIKRPCGATCTLKDCQICEQEELGGHCVCVHSEKENLEKVLEVYSDENTLEKYPFCDIVVQALKEKQEHENPQPLAYKQLLKRIGKPVYTIYNNSYDENVWGVVRVVGDTVSIHCPRKIILPREKETRMRIYDYELKEELSCKPHQEE